MTVTTALTSPPVAATVLPFTPAWLTEMDRDGGTAASTIETVDTIEGPNAALPFCGVPNVTTTVSTSSFETPSSKITIDKLPERPLAIVTVSATAE